MRIVRRDGGPAQGRRLWTQPSWQPTAGGNAQSKRSISRPRRARCCYICGFCFYEIWGGALVRKETHLPFLNPTHSPDKNLLSETRYPKC